MKKNNLLKVLLLACVVVFLASVIYPHVSLTGTKANEDQNLDDLGNEIEENPLLPDDNVADNQNKEDDSTGKDEENNSSVPGEEEENAEPKEDPSKESEEKTDDVEGVPVPPIKEGEKKPETSEQEIIDPTALLEEPKEFTIEMLETEMNSIFLMNIDEFSSIPSDVQTDAFTKIYSEIISRHSYTESDEKSLYERISNDSSYAVGLMKDMYGILQKEAKDFEAKPSTVKSPTNRASSDVKLEEDFESLSNKNKDALVPDYLKSMSRKVTPETEKVLIGSRGENVEKFRQYLVTVGLDILERPQNKISKNADIVLVIDNSESMINNLDFVKKAATKFAYSMLPIGYDESMENLVKIKIIKFSETAEVVLDFSSNREEIVKAIESIELVSSDKTNIQAALLKAQEGFAEEDTREKIVLMLSDGVATTRTSDIWNFGEDGLTTIPLGDSEGAKKWTYLEPAGWDANGPVAEKIKTPTGLELIAHENEVGNSVEYFNQKELMDTITMLEAQLMVSKGIDLYSVTYNPNANVRDYIKTLSNKMAVTPTFNQDTSETVENFAFNPLPEYSVEDKEDFAVYSNSANKVLFQNISLRLGEEFENGFKSYDISDKLLDEFEFNGQEFVVSSNVSGSKKITDPKFNDITIVGNELKWTLPDDTPKGSYYLTYKVKVKEDVDKENPEYFVKGAGKELYGKDAEELAFLSSEPKVSFANSFKKEYDFEFTKVGVTVQPYLDVDFKSDKELYYTGDSIKLESLINTGSGKYAFKFYEYESESEDSKKLLKENIRFFPTKAFEVPLLEEEKLEAKEEGLKKYLLEVTDIISKEVLELPMELKIIEPKLRVKIIDSEGGTSLEGAFETRMIIDAINEDAPPTKEVYYLAGLGEREYTYLEGSKMLKMGSIIDVNTYVPYGYSIVSVKDTDGDGDGKVKIDAIVDPEGNLTGYDHEIEIVVKQDRTKYFFNWTWIMNSIAGKATSK